MRGPTYFVGDNEPSVASQSGWADGDRSEPVSGVNTYRESPVSTLGHRGKSPALGTASFPKLLTSAAWWPPAPDVCTLLSTRFHNFYLFEENMLEGGLTCHHSLLNSQSGFQQTSLFYVSSAWLYFILCSIMNKTFHDRLLQWMIEI